MSILADKNTRVLIQGITGNEGRYHAALMKAYEVSRVVNSVRNDVEACIEPLQNAADSPQTRLNL